MKQLVILALVIFSISPFSEVPICNLPTELATHNYAGGSCVYASTESAFAWCNAPDWQVYYREHYSGGSSAGTLARTLDKNGLKYVQTTSGDVNVLDWAMRTRRMCIIAYHPNHYINLVHLDDKWAGCLNNNSVDKIEWYSREEFIKNWKGYGGEATVLLYDPVPPLPHR